MTKQNDIKTFDDLSEKFSTWIIKYCSPKIESSLYIIWYTDTDENNSDKLLTLKSGEIFAVTSLSNLKSTIVSSIDKLIEFDNLKFWLENFNDIEVKEYCTYDISKTLGEIDKNNLDIETLENFVNFVNLFEDFTYQSESNLDLKIFADNTIIKDVWNYFYNFIFWPRLNDKEKFEKWNKPELAIDTKVLYEKLNDLVKIFDNNIRQI